MFEKGFSARCTSHLWRFCPDENTIASYGNRIRVKYTAKWSVQIAGMLFQTGSREYWILLKNS
ncbi:MAG: DUF6783 domain-containing protein [Ruminococcus sp.]